MLKRRKGNILITLFVFFSVVLIVSALMNLTVAQKNQARANAVRAGETMSYIALSNLCADAFQSDLESMTCRFESGWPITEFTQAIYTEAERRIEDKLKFSDGAEPGTWYHKLRDPSEVIEYIGMTDSNALEFSNDLLKGATVSILIHNPLEIGPMDKDDQLRVEDGDKLSFNEIEYRVILEKGTTQVVQEYKLTGEKLVARFEMAGEGEARHVARVWLNVNGDEAVNDLISQHVTRNNQKKLNG